MTPTLPNITEASRHELAQRSADGLEVTLYWNPTHDSVSVEVGDLSSGDEFEISVPRDRALNAFHHPFAYAASFNCGFAPLRARAA